MKILLDQGTPVPLRRYLEGHSVTTAYEQGWSELLQVDKICEIVDATRSGSYVEIPI